ncbi:hypothetical protein B0F90DRAFT_1671958 [Multifurca ochricompacta]|uniref:Uncharacterized protein n=1 Tax=Multifurca ochricompacta TaxID=376703 RepID=A0AAD4QIW4_9AGAM|nr:hypothetical protein B0F90DRAFT_1671958 [Multifurca ochricompacta]
MYSTFSNAFISKYTEHSVLQEIPNNLDILTHGIFTSLVQTVLNLLVESRGQRECGLKERWVGKWEGREEKSSSRGHSKEKGLVKAHMSWTNVSKSLTKGLQAKWMCRGVQGIAGEELKVSTARGIEKAFQEDVGEGDE